MHSGHLPLAHLSPKAGQICSSWSQWRHTPSLAEVSYAAALASLGSLRAVPSLRLVDLDLSR